MPIKRKPLVRNQEPFGNYTVRIVESGFDSSVIFSVDFSDRNSMSQRRIMTTNNPNRL